MIDECRPLMFRVGDYNDERKRYLIDIINHAALRGETCLVLEKLSAFHTSGQPFRFLGTVRVHARQH